MEKFKRAIRENLNLFILSVILIGLAVFWKELFFVLILIYILFIKLLFSKYIEGGKKKNLSILIWSLVIILSCLMFYVNYYMPHGPSYSTGDIACQGEYGPCGEGRKEDVGGLDIPDWAKFVRSSEGMLLLMGLFFAGIVVIYKDKEEENY